MFRSWRDIQIHAKIDLKITKKLTKLSPIILSHGITANRSLYSCINQELASFGHIVFVLDHLDGSGSYTVKRNGSAVKIDTTLKVE